MMIADKRDSERRFRIGRRRRWLTPSHVEQVLKAVEHCQAATMRDIAVTITAQQYGVWAISGLEASVRLRELVADLVAKEWLVKTGKKYSLPV